MGRVTAIIPARGGSKGIPGKNLKPFLGVPLIGRTILAARQANTVDDVLVSSDDDAILAVAEGFGAATLRRPPALATDQSSSEAALLHAIDAAPVCAEAKVIVFLQCTSPLTTPEEIDLVVSALAEQKADVAIGVVEVHTFLWEIAADGTGISVNHDWRKPRQRRQDRPAQYRETGAIYALDRAGFVAAQSRFFGRVVPVPLPTGVDFDLDTLQDWQILEALGQSREHSTA